MRRYALLSLLLAASASAQGLPQDRQPLATNAAAAWDPVGPYITAGQDEAGYRNWYAAAPGRPVAVKAFHDYLAMHGVGGVFPTWQLLRTATSWQRCGSEPFEVPPVEEWPNIVQTLRYVHGFVIPAVGRVEPVSGYRNPHLNICAGGASQSAHKHYSAIDMVPLEPTTRERLIAALCAAHASRGTDYQAGLGFYSFLRFHVDTTKYRRWGSDATARDCPPIIRSSDIATVAAVAPTQGSMAGDGGAASLPTQAPIP